MIETEGTGFDKVSLVIVGLFIAVFIVAAILITTAGASDTKAKQPDTWHTLGQPSSFSHNTHFSFRCHRTVGVYAVQDHHNHSEHTNIAVVADDPSCPAR